MKKSIVCAVTCPNFRIVAAVAALMMPAAVIASGAFAQTLTDPNPKTPASPPVMSQSPPSKHVKSCSTYGAGFVYIPKTDACIKIGGFVRIEGGVAQER